MTTLPASRRSTTPVSPRDGLAPSRLCLWIPASALTHAGFRSWATSGAVPDHVRLTFLDHGIYVDMSNEEPETHVLVKGEVSRVLANLTRELKLGQLYPDGLLLSNEAAEVSNNPDALFVIWDNLEQRRTRLVPREGEKGPYREMEGTPDWVLEVVSDSSVEKDTDWLRSAYHRAGIPEYWLIDARGEEIRFHILVWRKQGYAAAPRRGGWQRSPVFGHRFRLTRERVRLGLWEYTLHARPG